MSPNMKLMPNLDQESTKVLNLRVLQRLDAFVEEILFTAAHVTFYEFNIERSEWSRKDVEGSLFVVKRNAQPRFQFIVMNRRNTDNLVEDLLGDFEYEIQIPYLLYRNAKQEVNGIWFYNQRDCEDVANLFSRIINAYSKISPKAKTSIKSDFEELEAAPAMVVMEGPPEPPSSSASTITNVPEDSSFVNYFNAATSIGNTSNATNVGTTYQPPAVVIPLPSRSAHLPTTGMPGMQPPSILPTSSAPSIPFRDTSDMGISRAPNLVSPSVFLTPPSMPLSSAISMPQVPSSNPTAPPLHPPVNLQRPYGAPLLQPFPPPTPPPSLTPAIANNGSLITRDRVRDTLARLVQNHQFVDMVYEELMKGIS